jgi:flagellin
MSSIMTNASAMTALKSLQMTNKGLESTQARISTGFRVAQASDNAAYWSIATTMRSDNKAMGTVQDALGLGAAQVDVAYTAMEATKDVLDTIKTKLVAASQQGVDKSKIQSEISQLQSQLTSIATAASFSGTNWLSVDSSGANYDAAPKVVSSFTRASDGSVSIKTISVDLSSTALFDANTGGAGLLDAGVALAANGDLQVVAENAGDGAGTAAVAQAFGDLTSAITLDDNDEIKFDLIINGTSSTITINKAVVDQALSVTDGEITDAADMADVLVLALANAGIVDGVDVDVDATTAEIAHASDATTDTLEIANIASTSNGSYNTFSATTFNITNADADQLAEYVSGIEAMAAAVTTAASDLGAVKSRISMQKDFVSNLMDAVDRGVGALVDADMNKESTRLQALQVQQQLGIQALSIANGNAQSILSLFRS